MTNLDPNAGLALASQRHLFDIPDEVAFLNCAYISPLPKASLIAGDRGLRRKAQPWTIGAADFFTSSETVRKLLPGPGTVFTNFGSFGSESCEVQMRAICRPHQRRRR